MADDIMTGAGQTSEFSEDMAELNRPDETITPEEDDEKRVPSTEPEEGEPAEEEGDEDEAPKEDEEDEEVEEEESSKVQPIHARPTVRQITSKYPNFFKEFPDMRHMLFREGEYSKVFPTVEDARGAAGDAESFNKFASLLSSGQREDFSEFLSGVKEAKGLESMAANFLPALYKQDSNLYFRITSPIGETMVRNAYNAAVQAGNENLKNAALHIAQWAFGDLDYATGEKRTEDYQPAQAKTDPELERERNEFYATKYRDAQDYVQNNSRGKLINEIKRGLDPHNSLTQTMQNLLVKEILNEMGASLERDARHMAIMNSLWKQAHRAGFAGDWKDRILTTYLSRARQIMPAIRSKIREGAFKTEEAESVEREKIATKSSDRKEIHAGGGKPNGKVPGASQIDWSRTSDLDILSDRITLKKR